MKCERRQELGDVMEMALALVASVKADRFRFVLPARRFKGKMGIIRALRYFFSKLADFKLDSAQ